MYYIGTAFHKAAASKDETLNELIADVADVHQECICEGRYVKKEMRFENWGFQAIHLAADLGINSNLEVLLQAQADPNAKVHGDGKHEFTPLCQVAFRGFVDCVETLLQEGADPQIMHGDGQRPLHIAAEWGHPDCVIRLLEHGAEIGEPNRNGDTPLTLALNSRLFCNPARNMNTRFPKRALYLLARPKFADLLQVTKDSPDVAVEMLQGGVRWNTQMLVKSARDANDHASPSGEDLAQLISWSPRVASLLVDLLTAEPFADYDKPLPRHLKIYKFSRGTRLVDYSDQRHWLASRRFGNDLFIRTESNMHWTRKTPNPQLDRRVDVRVLLVRNVMDSRLLDALVELSTPEEVRLFNRPAIQALVAFMWGEHAWASHMAGLIISFLEVLLLGCVVLKFPESDDLRRALWTLLAASTLRSLWIEAVQLVNSPSPPSADSGNGDAGAGRGAGMGGVAKGATGACSGGRQEGSWRDYMQSRMEYFMDWWNVMDITTIICLATAIVGAASSFDFSHHREFLALASLSRWIQLLCGIAQAHSVGTVVMPLFRSLKELRGIGLVVMFAFAGFVHAYLALVTKSLDTQSSDPVNIVMLNAFRLLFLGDGDGIDYALKLGIDEDANPDGSFFTQCFLFCGVIVFGVLIMNLFIAVHGAAYEAEAKAKIENFYLNWARACHKFYLMPSWRPVSLALAMRSSVWTGRLELDGTAGMTHRAQRSVSGAKVDKAEMTRPEEGLIATALAQGPTTANSKRRVVPDTMTDEVEQARPTDEAELNPPPEVSRGLRPLFLWGVLLLLSVPVCLGLVVALVDPVVCALLLASLLIVNDMVLRRMMVLGWMEEHRLNPGQPCPMYLRWCSWTIDERVAAEAEEQEPQNLLRRDIKEHRMSMAEIREYIRAGTQTF